MADCVIHVDQRVTAQVTTRRLRVIKYRGSGYGRNEYPFIISDERHQHHSDHQQRVTAPPSRFQSVERPGWLDDVLGGGYKRGRASWSSGTAGAGKTTLACVFAQAACRRGERVLVSQF